MTSGGLLLAPRKLSAKEKAARAELITAGDEAFDAEDYERALECYHRASVLDGSDPDIWAYLGLTFSNLDFPREAWRSYKLALTADPEHTDTLWYAAEFLANLEDYVLAKIMLERYILRETDANQLSLARELLQAVSQHVPETQEAGSQRQPIDSDDPEDEVFGDLDDDELELDTDDDEDSLDDDDDFGSDALDYEDNSYVEQNDEAFVANLTLQLGGMETNCGNCRAAIPLDAPYCYNCNAIQFYRD